MAVIGEQQTSGNPGWLSGAVSDTALADEYQRIKAAFEPAKKSGLAPDLGRYSSETIDKAARWWLATMRTEYESASTFMQMATRLRAINDPLDIQAVTLRMAQDELRHAGIAADVVAALGGRARIRPAPPHCPAPHKDCDPEEQALREVVFGCCLSETVSAARLVKRFGDAEDAFIKDAFRRLLSDERLHAQFGYYYLQSRRAWLDSRPRTRRRLERYLRFAFAVLERQLGSVSIRAQTPTEAELALGLPDLTDLSQTFQAVVLNVCVPGLEQFGIDAGRAWRARSLEPAVRDSD